MNQETITLMSIISSLEEGRRTGVVILSKKILNRRKFSLTHFNKCFTCISPENIKFKLNTSLKNRTDITNCNYFETKRVFFIDFNLSKYLVFPEKFSLLLCYFSGIWLF